jgi:polyribonucleotide nucleotidyltransferase
MGTVRKIMEFGAFVEIFPGTDGLVHVSELDKERVRNVTDILKEGDQVLVKCLDIDRQGKIKLSRKEALGQTLPEEG